MEVILSVRLLTISAIWLLFRHIMSTSKITIKILHLPHICKNFHGLQTTRKRYMIQDVTMLYVLLLCTNWKEPNLPIWFNFLLVVILRHVNSRKKLLKILSIKCMRVYWTSSVSTTLHNLWLPLSLLDSYPTKWLLQIWHWTLPIQYICCCKNLMCLLQKEKELYRNGMSCLFWQVDTVVLLNQLLHVIFVK